MSLAPTKGKSSQKKKPRNYKMILMSGGAFLVFVTLLLYVLPVFVNPFRGFRSIMPLIALISGILGTGLLATAFFLEKKIQLASTVGLSLFVLTISTYIAWFRYNTYVYQIWNSIASPELFSPLHIFMGSQSYKQQEYGAGVALTCAFVLLGVLVSCVPIFRARDIPENIEKEKQKALRQQSKATPFRVRPMR